MGESGPVGGGLMRCDTEDDRAAKLLYGMAETLREAGGFVAEEFTVHERGGDFWCSVAGPTPQPGRVLVDYPAALTVPLGRVEWADDPTTLAPVAGIGGLADPQRRLLDAWLDLVNGAEKLITISQRVPRFAVADPVLRDHLAGAGYPDMAEPRSDTPALHRTLIAWHSMGTRTESPDEPGWRLIPLKQLVNHHPDGTPQHLPNPGGRVTVLTGPNSTSTQTYENYGDLDALQLVMLFGYVDDTTRLVHSVPVEIPEAPGGPIRVWARAPRNPRAQVVPDVPVLREEDGRLLMRHLTVRKGNRGRVRDYLAMAIRSRAGVSAEAAARAAEEILDDVVAANIAYYAELDRILDRVATRDAGDPGDRIRPRRSRQSDAVASRSPGDADPVSGTAPVGQMLRDVSRIQRQRLASWWGSTG